MNAQSLKCQLYQLKFYYIKSKVRYSAKKLLRWLDDESLATASYNKTRENKQIIIFKADDKRKII